MLALCGTLVSLLTGTTLAGASTQVTAHASATNRGLVVAGKRFFPVMLIDQCTAGSASHAAPLGVNLIINESCPDVAPARQLTMLRGNALAVLTVADRNVRGSGLAGWTYPDEPEGNGWTAASLAKAHPYVRGNTDGLVTFMTTGAGFFRAPYRTPQVPRTAYRQFARLADMAGFDMYPLGHCQSDLSAVYDAQREFALLAGSTPTFQWIETGPIRPTYCGGFTMTPAELKAEVWLAVAGGARGIGYFTHTWSPAHSAFDVPASVQHAMTRTDALISAVTPGLLGSTLLSSTNSPAIKLIARSGGGKTYLFAVNATRSPVAVQLNVPALHDGSVTVFGEKRTVTAASHRLVDNFNALEVHVYVQQR